MKDKVYIASPFFNEDQIEHVKTLEQHYENVGVDYFSPRTFVLDLSPNNPERESNAKKLFDKDLEEIHNCNLMDAYIDETFDMGTLFEVGYYIGINFREHRNFIDGIHFSGIHGEDIKNWISDELDNQCWPNMMVCDSEWGFDPFDTTPLLIYPEDTLIKFLIQFVSIPKESLELPGSVLLRVADCNLPVFIIDNRPWKAFILMGIFKAFGVPFMTASCQNYGSNIMIASASLGHIMLPSFVNPYKQNIEIK